MNNSTGGTRTVGSRRLCQVISGVFFPGFTLKKGFVFRRPGLVWADFGFRLIYS